VFELFLKAANPLVSFLNFEQLGNFWKHRACMMAQTSGEAQGTTCRKERCPACKTGRASTGQLLAFFPAYLRRRRKNRNPKPATSSRMRLGSGTTEITSMPWEANRLVSQRRSPYSSGR